MALVLLLTVFVDLITAVAAGVVVASLAFVKQLADEQLKKFSSDDVRIHETTAEERALLAEAGGAVTIFDFGGPLSFGAAADLGHKVRERTRNKSSALILDFSRVPFVDVSAARAVETIICDARQAGKLVYETGMNDSVRGTLAALNATHCLPVDTGYENRVDALRAAVAYVAGQRKQGGTAGGPAALTGSV
jgi:SulP family sulfate permease